MTDKIECGFPRLREWPDCYEDCDWNDTECPYHKTAIFQQPEPEVANKVEADSPKNDNRFRAYRQFERFLFPYGHGNHDTPGGIHYGEDH